MIEAQTQCATNSVWVKIARQIPPSHELQKVSPTFFRSLFAFVCVSRVVACAFVPTCVRSLDCSSARSVAPFLVFRSTVRSLNLSLRCVCLRSFARLLVHSIFRSLVRSTVRSLNHSRRCVCLRSFVRSFAQLLVHSAFRSLVYSFSRPFARSFASLRVPSLVRVASLLVPS